MIFKTKRCVIRELVASDINVFAKIHANPNIMEIIPAPVLSTLESEEKLDAIIGNYKTKKSNVTVWGIETTEYKKLIGLCALVFDKDNRIEIGYRIDEEFWGKRFGSEITPELINYAFESTNAREVYADVNSQNYKSIKILERVLEYKGKTANSELDVMDLNYGMKRNVWLLKK